MSKTQTRVAALGECMIELTPHGTGLFRQGFGGDTLNTAVYMARLGVNVDYVTALGDDPFSDDMIAAWKDEGVGTDHVRRVPGWLPGLYVVCNDADGERRFHYWRDASPARDLFRHPEPPALEEYSLLHLSGISLAIWGRTGREHFYDLVRRFRDGGGRISFDTNFRPRLWPNRDDARAAYERMFELTDLAFPGVGDLRDLFGDDDCEAAAARVGKTAREIVIKLDRPGAVVVTADGTVTVPAERVEKVVDTTAAGDSFAAGYLAARLAGRSPADSARAGHRMAALVIQYPGAIIPRQAMDGFAAF